VPASNLRFIILGDDRGSSAFDRFARSVDRANGAVARNDAALKRQDAAAKSSQVSLAGLTGSIFGVGNALGKNTGKMGLYSKVMLGINLATGLLEPAMSGLIVVAGGVAAAFSAGAVGLGAYGLVMSNVMTTIKKLTTLQQQAAGGSKAAQKQLTLMLKGLSPAFLAFWNQLDKTKTQYRAWATGLEKPVLTPLTQGLRLVHPLLKALSPAVRTASGAIQLLVNDVTAAVKGGGFARWVKAMGPAIFATIVNLGRTIGHIFVGVGGIMRAFAPEAIKVTGVIERGAAKFAQWGQTLGRHSGFQALMAMFKQDTPLVTAILKNLVMVLKNVGANMAGISTPANSKALLQLLGPLTSILATLSRNKGLVQFVMYMLLAKSALGQTIGPLKSVKDGITTTFANIKTARQWLFDFSAGFRNANAAASEFTGTAGTIGGKVKSLITTIGSGAKTMALWTKATVLSSAAWAENTARVVAARVAAFAAAVAQKAEAIASKIAAAAQWLWNVALDANPIGLVIIAVAALVVGVVYAYKHFRWFRDFVQAVWQAILVAVRAVVSWFTQTFLPFFTKTVPAAWRTVRDAAVTAWHFVGSVFDTVTTAIRKGIAWLADKVLGYFGMILHGAADMLGWIPGLGDKLKEAAAKFDQFRRDVNGSLTGINNRTVNVGVAFGGTFQAPGQGKHTLAAGGLVTGPGTGTSDTAGLYALSNKEFVHNAAAVDYYGQAFMEAVNAKRFPKMAQGGRPGGVSVTASLPAKPVIQAAVWPPVEKLAQMMLTSGVFTTVLGATIARMALSYVGRVPYVWGGTTPAGWDCSGMTFNLYRRAGISGIPRTAAEQQHWARHIGFPMAGALAFFAGADGTAANAGHVGIVVGANRMVNAYGTGFGTIISPFTTSGPFGGFGIPPGRSFRRGGWIDEPVVGVGLRTGRRHSFAESGREYVAGSDVGEKLDYIAGLLGELIGAVDDNARSTAAGVAAALGGPSRRAAFRAEYSPR